MDYILTFFLGIMGDTAGLSDVEAQKHCAEPDSDTGVSSNLECLYN